MTVTSISLLDRARDDVESESWDQLVAIYSPLLRRWVGRFEIQSADADDLGHTGDHGIKIKLELQGAGPDRRVRQFQFQRETRSAFRSLKGKQLVDERNVPRVVLEQARDVAETYGAPFKHIARVKQGTVQGRRAFDIRARSDEWRVEVELLDDGEVLEVELERYTST